MVPKLYKEEGKKTCCIISASPCLPRFPASAFPHSLPASVQSLQPEEHANYLLPPLPIFPSPSSVWIFFFYCPSVSPETEIFYLSFPLEMKRCQYGWIGGYCVYIFLPSILFPLVSSSWPLFLLSLFVQCVCECVHSSRFFTIFFGIQSQLIICGWILCPEAMRELRLIQWFLSNTCRGWNREA